jgi:hypothetical protein
MKRRVFFLVTVDGDLRVGTPEQQEAGIRAMRGVHRQQRLLGRTSWMINEVDFHWTDVHPGLLLELVDSDEHIGIHDHLDTHNAEEYGSGLELMRLSKSALEVFFHRHGRSITIDAHRNGCAFQSEAWYRAQMELGYRIVSDVWPGMVWSGRMVCNGRPPSPWRQLEADDPDAITMDNRAVPLTVLPWRHNPANWLDCDSHSGPFLQVPITSMPQIDRRRFEIAADNGRPDAFLLVDTHPYDMQDPLTGDVSAERVEAYRRSLEWVTETFRAEAIRLDQVEAFMPA